MYQNTNTQTLAIENAHIFFRNFSGKASRFNAEGNRNFCVEIEDVALAGALLEDGWNVRTLAPRESEEDIERYYIQVAVSYKNNPPSVWLITKKGKTPLNEESISILDHADIALVDMTVKPYNWEVGGKSGVKGYLKSMYVTIEEDEFADKYADPADDESEDLPF